MLVKTLSQYLEKLEKTASRNEITAILADLFTQASADEIDKICYLLLGRLAPQYRSIEFNLAEKMMIKVGGNPNDALEYAKSLLNKAVKSGDVFSSGQFVDVVSITKGKGWQGVVKRFGVSKQRPKASKKVRHIGNLGSFKPPYVTYEIPQAGQMGYHRRTEYNKLIVKISDKSEEINPSGGFPGYGIVKNSYILLKGSVPGPKKRLVRLRVSVRKTDMTQPVQLSYVSKEPQN